jgi:thiamine-phosphate pyrophosphorylase
VNPRLQSARLYGILDLGYVAEDRALEVAGDLLAGGVGVLQLRAKNYDESSITEIARSLVPLCRGAEVPLIVNDHPRATVDSGADGVHVGQDDGALEQVRSIVGPRAIVGRSTHSPEQARAALAEGFDYIGFGPLFATPTKPGRPAIGLDGIAGVECDVGGRIPVFCIGGIKPGNLGQVLAAGARRVVVVSALLEAGDVAESARELRARLER